MIGRTGVRDAALAVAMTAVLTAAAADAAGAAQAAVPEPVGMMPAAEAPEGDDPGNVGPILRVTGFAFLLGGTVIGARSWVSTRDTV